MALNAHCCFLKIQVTINHKCIAALVSAWDVTDISGSYAAKFTALKAWVMRLQPWATLLSYLQGYYICTTFHVTILKYSRSRHVKWTVKVYS